MSALPGFTRDAVGNLIRRVGSGIATARRSRARSTSRRTSSARSPTTATCGCIARARRRRFRSGTRRSRRSACASSRRTAASAACSAWAPSSTGTSRSSTARDTTIVGVDQLWIDVGATSRADAERLGIALLDPVIADRPAWTYEGYAAGPGRRRARRVRGRRDRRAGHGGERRDRLHPRGAARDELVRPERCARAARALRRPHADRRRPRRTWARRRPSPSFRARVSPARSSSRSARPTRATCSRRPRPPPASRSRRTSSGWRHRESKPAARTARTDAYEAAERQVMALLDLPAVHPHEWRVADAVKAALPAWARAKATIDSAGNVIVDAGPDKDPVAFVAHMDEVGFTLDRILPDGSVDAEDRWRRGRCRRGKGEVALLYFDRARERRRSRAAPRRVRSARHGARQGAAKPHARGSASIPPASSSRGVRPGAMIIGYKHAERLGALRLTGRSSDDRTGSSALLAGRARHRSRDAPAQDVLRVGRRRGGRAPRRTRVRREVRHDAHAHLCDRHLRFVSDTPLELPTFALAPLGKGPVLRGLDNSTVVSRVERDRVIGSRANGGYSAPGRRDAGRNRRLGHRHVRRAEHRTLVAGALFAHARAKCSTCATSTRSASSSRRWR